MHARRHAAAVFWNPGASWVSAGDAVRFSPSDPSVLAGRRVFRPAAPRGRSICGILNRATSDRIPGAV